MSLPSRSEPRLARSGRCALLIAALALIVSACGTDPGDSLLLGETDEDLVGDAGDDRHEEAGSGDGASREDDDAAADDTATTPDGDPELVVVSTVAPVADLIARVGGSRVAVDTLVPPGADAHTYEPRPQDVVGISQADAYLGVGLALNDGALRLAEANLPEGAPLILLGEALADDTLVFDHSHGDHGHSHDDHGHSHDDHGHSHDDHGHGDGDGDGELGPNPHVWTSLRNAVELVGIITVTLADLDPEGAAYYERNADRLLDDLRDLERTVRNATVTIPAANRTLVTYHDAWTYFARDHDLDFATAIQPADYAEPSAAEVRQLIDLIRALGVDVVFGSEEFPTPVLEAIAEETEATYVADLADDVLPGEPGSPEHTYLELMRRNAWSIVHHLGGDASQLERWTPPSGDA